MLFKSFKTTNVVVVILATTLYASVSAEENATTVSGSPREKIMTVDQIKPGMKGKGLTVFQGDKIEEFGVEVIGVVKNYFVKGDLILIRTIHPITDKAGIVAGMSGSPIYIDGKLIGALAYAWSFSKEPIAGVTPIADMLPILYNHPSEDEKEKQKRKSPKYAVSESVHDEWGEAALSRQGKDPFRELAYELAPVKATDFAGVESENDAIMLEPIQTPLMVSGVSRRLFERMRPIMRKFGMTPVQSGGAADVSIDSPLVPGAAIAVQLSKGDMDMAGVGTVTYRDGDRLIAFGHDMFLAGKSKLPMASAYVHTVLASQSRSFKLTATGKTLGAITQDRRSGIGGELGRAPRMIPCTVTVNNAATGGARKFHFEILDEKSWTPTLADWAMEDSVVAADKSSGETMMDLKMEIKLANRKQPLVIQNKFFEQDMLGFQVFMMTRPIHSLMNTRLGKVKIESINFYANLRDERKTATIEGIRIGEKKIRLGEALGVTVLLRPYGQDEYVTKEVKLDVPINLAMNRPIISVAACSAAVSQMMERTRSPGRFSPTNLEQLIELVQKQESNTDLIVKAIVPSSGVTVRGHALPALPSSLLSIMANSNQSGVGFMYDEISAKIKTEWVLSGSQMTRFVLEREMSW